MLVSKLIHPNFRKGASEKVVLDVKTGLVSAVITFCSVEISI